jgi:hypothetical protein
MASWPFCDTFFLSGKSVADGGDYTAQNAALLGRSLGTAFVPTKPRAKGEEDWGAGLGSFHEKIPLPEGLIDGSGISSGQRPRLSTSASVPGSWSTKP